MKRFIFDIRYTGSLIIEADSEKEALSIAQLEVPLEAELEVVSVDPNESD